MPITNDEHRQARHDKVYAVAYESVTRTRPTLTEGQRKALAAKVIELGAFRSFIDEPHWPTPDDNGIELQIGAYETLYPAMFRAVPDTKALAVALLAQRPHSPVEQLTMSRRINTMTPDELLAASEGLDLSKSAPKATEAQLTPWETARQTGWSKEDQILKDRGHDPEAMLADKRIELRYAVAVETAPKPTPGIDEIKFRMSTLGVKFADLDPKLQIKAQHEAGKNVSLATFGIDVTK